MTPFLVIPFSNLHILWNLQEAIRKQSFNAVGCLSQVLERDWQKHNDAVVMTSLHILGFHDLHIMRN